MSVPLQLMPFFPQTFFNTDGSLLAGGKLYSYEAGSSTPQATYTDATGATPNANPTVLNSVGQASIFLGAGLGYKLVLFDSLGNQLASADQVYSMPPGSILNSALADMAAGTIKGNNTDSSAAPSDLTTAQVTAMLEPFEGDSGLGGAQGLVPAPPAGATAGNYSLSPNGSWVSGDNNRVEIVFKNKGEFAADGKMSGWPQFPWSAPTLLAQPTTLPATSVTAAKWSPGMEYLACAVGGLTGPQFLVYQRVLNTLLPVSTAGVNAQPGIGATGISWSPDGEYVAVSFLSVSPGFYIYKRKGSIFNSLAAPAVTPVSGANGIAFSPNGEFLAVAATGATPLFIYQRQTNQSFLQGIPGGTVNGSLAASPGLALSTGNNYTDAVVNNAFANNVIPTLDKNASEIQNVVNQNSFLTTFSCINNLYTFTVTALTELAAINATFTNNGQTFTVAYQAIAGATTLVCSGTGAPAASGSLTLASGVGQSSITFASAAQATNPSALAAGNGIGVAWSPDGQFVVVTTDSAPYIQVYQRSGSIFTAININLQYTFTVTALTSQTDIGAVYTNNGQNFTVALPANIGDTTLFCFGTGNPDTSGTLTLSSGTGQASITFSAYALPALPTAQANCVSFSPNSQFMVVGFNASPYVLIYQISGSTFTAINAIPQYTFVVTALTNQVQSGATYTNNTQIFTVIQNASVGAQSLVCVGTGAPTASGTLTLSTGVGQSSIAFSSETSTAVPTGRVQSICWSPNGLLMALGLFSSPYIMVFSVSGTIFTPQAAPVALPAGAVGGLDFSPNCQMLAAGGAGSPYINVYETASTMPTNANLYASSIPNV